jgi:hypothetical protein
MAVPAVNITIQKGTDFQNVYTISNPDGSPLDLTGYSGVAKIKKFPESTTSSSFTVGIVSTAGQVVLSMASTVTSQLGSGRHYYDILLTSPSSKKDRTFEGMALVTSTVSV